MVQTCPVLLLFHSSWPTFKTKGKKKLHVHRKVRNSSLEVAMMNMKKKTFMKFGCVIDFYCKPW